MSFCFITYESAIHSPDCFSLVAFLIRNTMATTTPMNPARNITMKKMKMNFIWSVISCQLLRAFEQNELVFFKFYKVSPLSCKIMFLFIIVMSYWFLVNGFQ